MKTTTKAEEAARHAAEEYGLNEDQFTNFWNQRFGRNDPGYAREWAERIANGRAHFVADDETLAALRQAGYTGGE